MEVTVMNKIQALNEFWNSFDLIAYDENTVREDAELPYITYEVASSDFNDGLTLSGSLWYRSTSWKDITEKSLEIEKAISNGGKMIEYDDGSLWVRKGSPFAQRMSDSDDTIRRIYINISVEFISMN